MANHKKGSDSLSNPNCRDSRFHIIPDAISRCSREECLSVFRHMTRAREFENCIVRVDQAGKFQIKVHMSSGQEAVSAALATVAPAYQYFIQHRSMDIFLALGGAPEEVRDEINCLPGGCVGGKLGGAFQYHRDGRDLYAHTGLIGENIPVGVGAALGNGRRTVCLFGDGAAEEDYALTAYGFAATHRLPVLFVCTDNRLSVLSPLAKRRSWDLCEVAAGFGIPSYDMTDDPFTIMQRLREVEDHLPALFNIQVCRDYWHAGTGIDQPPEWNRYALVREQIAALGLASELEQIERAARREMEDVWKDYL